jgi:spore coat-associated protein N
VKKILISVMTLALVAGMVGGAFAAFSDVETSEGNTFTAGTLDMIGVIDQVVTDGYGDVDIVNEGNGGNFAFTVTNVAPGSAGIDTWTLTNDGSIDGSLSITVSAVTNDDNGQNEPELLVDDAGPDGELGANLMAQLDVEGNVIYALGALDGMEGAYLGVIDIAAGDTVVVTLNWLIDIAVGNVIQSDIAMFDIEFTLEQTGP